MSQHNEQEFKKLISLLLLIALYACSTTTLSHVYVKNSIEEMIKKDQAARFPLDFDAMQTIDKENAPEIKKIIDHYGVPKKANVGEKAAHSFITLVLHLADLTYKNKVLDQLKDYAQQGIIQPKEYAYLYDKIAINEGRKQKWGTQGSCTERGTWEPDETEDSENLDARRKEIGLPPIQEYAKLVTDMACSGHKR